jgi:hypothetical protein
VSFSRATQFCLKSGFCLMIFWPVLLQYFDLYFMSFSAVDILRPISQAVDCCVLGTSSAPTQPPTSIQRRSPKTELFLITLRGLAFSMLLSCAIHRK